MSFTLTSPVTGATQTGFTAPTYTIVSDNAPAANAKQVAVTALGGTQAGVTAHSVSSPFTTTVFKPQTFQALGKPNPTTGLIARVPRNTFKIITRKGVLPLAGQPFQNAVITTIMEIPAGSDTADPSNLRAALSMHFGSVNQQAAGMGDSVVTGLI
jgi:hypothetical protein